MHQAHTHALAWFIFCTRRIESFAAAGRWHGKPEPEPKAE
jgi:hypothetical protein